MAIMAIQKGKKEVFTHFRLDFKERCKYDNEDMKLARVEIDLSGIYVTYTCPYCRANKKTAYVKVGEKYI